MLASGLALALFALPSAGSAALVLPPPVEVPRAEAPLRLAAWGDAGTADAAQQAVADAIAAEHSRAPFAAALVLGDNVYPHGEPQRFDAAIAAPYAELFDKGVRFLPVLGNHDVHRGHGDAQARYWGVPRWYSASLGDTDVFALDTTPLVSSAKHPENAELTETQLQWLDEALSRSGARHKLVIGHHPLYVSSNEPGKLADAARRRALLEPILTKHGVRLYLAGHQHHYERSRELGGVVHVVSGAGGQLSDDLLRAVSPTTEAVVQRRHFLILERHGDEWRGRAVSEAGETLDEFRLPAPAIR